MTTETLRSESAIDPIAISTLQRRMQGQLLTPATAGYDTARRLVNLRHDRRPALIARCRTSQDVAAAVAFARQHDLEIAVRSAATASLAIALGPAAPAMAVQSGSIGRRDRKVSASSASSPSDAAPLHQCCPPVIPSFSPYMLE